jgi:hypothetical protein
MKEFFSNHPPPKKPRQRWIKPGMAEALGSIVSLQVGGWVGVRGMSDGNVSVVGRQRCCN